MAASHPGVTEVQEQLRCITDCTVCRGILVNPRILPCLHAFCLNCLSQVAKDANKISGNTCKMPCPVCTTEFIIPTSGVERLQKNVFLQRMIERRRLLERTSGQIPCDTCNDEANNESSAVASAARHCLRCNLNLCEQCCAHHRRNRLTREHTLYAEASQTIFGESDDARMCQTHAGEEIKLYCKTCSDVLCSLCFIEKHQGHDWSSATEAGDNFRRQIQTSINDVDECNSRAAMKKELIVREIDRITKDTDRLRMELLKRRDDLKELVDKHAELLLEQVGSKLNDKIIEAETHGHENEMHLATLEKFKTYCSSFLAYATNDEICRAISELTTKAIELRRVNDTAVQHQMNPWKLSLKVTKLDKFSGLSKNIVGTIEDSANEELEQTSVFLTEANSDIDENTDTTDSEAPSQRYSSSPGLIENRETDEYSSDESVVYARVVTPQPRQHATGKDGSGQNPLLVQILRADIAVEKNKPIWGVTSLNDELYIVTKGSSQVEIYSLISFRATRNWNLDMLIDPQDITSCAKEKCLYVMDWRRAIISRVDPNGRLITEWSVPKRGGRLSVTHESTVLLAAYKANKLTEYRADGRLICDIQLSSEDGIAHPQHAVKLVGGGYVVSHGVITDPMNRVCIVNGSGKILKSFGGKPGSAVGRVNLPLHLAVNRDGSILVADWNNSRVLLLNSQLRFEKELISKNNGLRHPCRICLNESKGQLIVANNFNGWSDGQIHIFEI